MRGEDVEGKDMTTRKRATPIYAWAAVGKRNGKILLDLIGHYSIYKRERSAELDCPAYGRVARVRIVEIKR